MKKLFITAMILSLMAVVPATAQSKLPYHIAGVVLTEGTGGYSVATTALFAENDATKAAAYTNGALVLSSAAMGALTMAGVGDYATMQNIHKYMGWAVFAASIWLSYQNSVDPGTKGRATQYTSYGYTALASGPIILFSF